VLEQNNPGNIRLGHISWQGMVLSGNAFCAFDTAENGLRAMARILLNYASRDGCSTVADYIDRWAPPTENDDPAYVNDVCQFANLTPHTVVTPANLAALMSGMIHHENGSQPYSMELITQSVADASA